MLPSLGLGSPVLAALLWLVVCLAAQDPSTDLKGRAVTAFREGRMAEAEQVLRSLLVQSPRDAAALGFLATVLDAQIRYQDAEAYYRKALALTPQSVALLNNFDNHYAATGDKEKARQQFLRVVQLDPAHSNANLQLARFAVEARHGREALDYLSRLRGETPGIALLRAEALHWAGHLPESLAALEAFEKGAGGDPALLTALGLTLARIEQYARAEQVFTRVLQSNPADTDALYNLGLAAARAGHFERAQAALESALKSRPDDAAILAALGRVYATREDYSRAVALLAEARKRSPKDAPVVLALARALDYAVTGRQAEAVADLKNHIARFPRDADGYFRLALITEQQDQAGALALLDRAVAVQPGFVPARYERGILLHKFGRSGDAAKDLEAAAAAEPDHTGILGELGLVYLALGRPAEAERVLRRAAEWAPEDRGVLMHRGRALSELGKAEDSRAVLEKLDSLGPEKRTPERTGSVLGLLSLPPSQRLERFVASLQRAVERKPGDTGLRLQLAKVLLEAGRKDEATPVLRGIEDNQPVTAVQIATVLRSSSGPAAALEELDKVPEAARDGRIQLLRAECLDEMGRRPEARAAIERAIDTISGAPDLAVRAAVLRFKWSEYGPALELADKAAAVRSALLWSKRRRSIAWDRPRRPTPSCARRSRAGRSGGGPSCCTVHCWHCTGNPSMPAVCSVSRRHSARTAPLSPPASRTSKTVLRPREPRSSRRSAAIRRRAQVCY